MTCQGKIEHPMINDHGLISEIANAGKRHEELCEDCRVKGYMWGCPAGKGLRDAIVLINSAYIWEKESMASGLIGPLAVGPVLEAVK